MAGIEVKSTVDGQKIGKEITTTLETALGRIIAEEVTLMIVRTTQGVDSDNQPFVEYSPQYAEFKQKRGRNPSPPDLTFTGNMLSSITQTVQNTGGEIESKVFFGDAFEEAKARSNLKHRKFFGFTAEQFSRIRDKLAAALKG